MSDAHNEFGTGKQGLKIMECMVTFQVLRTFWSFATNGEDQRGSSLSYKSLTKGSSWLKDKKHCSSWRDADTFGMFRYLSSWWTFHTFGIPPPQNPTTNSDFFEKGPIANNIRKSRPHQRLFHHWQQIKCTYRKYRTTLFLDARVHTKESSSSSSLYLHPIKSILD